MHELTGGDVPTVDFAHARKTYLALHAAMQNSLVRSCHDMSEGGLAVCIAEMAFAGGLGVEIELPTNDLSNIATLFAESNTRFLVEVEAENADAFETELNGIPNTRIGTVCDHSTLIIDRDGEALIDASIDELKSAWQKPLAW